MKRRPASDADPDSRPTPVRAVDIAVAAALLTRLPLRLAPASARRGAAAAWAYPLVGAGIGLAAGAVHAGALWLGLPGGGAAGLALAAMVVTTGAFHEDGLADTADGLWGGWTRDRRLEIMRDSRIGTYGVLALILALLLRWQGMLAIAGTGPLWPALVAAGALSRGAMASVWAALPSARPDGLASAGGRPGRVTAGLAAALALGLAAAALPGDDWLTAALAAGGAAAIAGWIASVKIGGQTGDILGATQQLAEIAALLALAAVLAG